MKTWLKYGWITTVILAVVYITIVILTNAIQLQLPSILTTFLGWPFILVGELLNRQSLLGIIIPAIFTLIYFFAIGAIIGLIIGKIKSRA